MSIVETNALKDIQCYLEEAGLYTGVIDGIFGHNSSTAFDRLMLGKTRLGAYDYREPKEVFKAIQQCLKDIGLYPGYIDGLWGLGSRIAMRRAFRAYRATKDTPGYDLAWSSLVSKEFTDRVTELSAMYNLPSEFPDWLMASMHFETGGTFSPSIQNGAGAQYYGLIQFGKAAAKDLGTTVEALRAMSQLEQLEWVFKYFNMWRKRGKEFNQLEDIYLSIFYPAAVGKNADTIIFKKGTIGYRQNRGLDLDRNGYLLVGEVCRKIYNVYYKGRLTKNRRTF